jgi:hypothetical protein
MKRVCTAIALILTGYGPILASEQEPTKAELLSTVRHIAAIAKQQQADLDSANAALSDAQTVEIPKLQKEISDQAKELAQTKVKLKSTEESRHKYVKFMWYSIALNVAAGLWIFKRPLLMMAGGIGI